ncbi:hypothetical protein [Clostridium butyricum]
MNILVYEETVSAWCIKNMENMTKTKADAANQEEKKALMDIQI